MRQITLGASSYERLKMQQRQQCPRLRR